jgi:hypothetical protein
MGDLGGTKAVKHSKQYFATMPEPTKEGKAALKPSSASSDTLFANNNPHNIGALQKVIDPI